MHVRTSRLAIVVLGLAAVLLSGCGVGIQPLMPTPVLFTACEFSPIDHTPEKERWLPRRVYYATNRTRDSNRQKIDYANSMSDRVAMGLALIGFDSADMSWSALDHASSQSDRTNDFELSIAGIIEAGSFTIGDTPDAAMAPSAAGFIVEDLEDAIQDARDKDILVYVHGAKVNFYNACVFAAQLDHFMGRDMTSVAFAWPTRQDIFAYAFGTDVQRGYESAEALADLLELLARGTTARRIHVLSWSAGGRVASRALALLRERHPDVPVEDLRAQFRLGTAYFAAGDVPVDEFLGRAEAIHGLVDQLVVTLSSHDEALEVGGFVMGGERRIGLRGHELGDEQIELILSLERLQVVDVSLGSESRGFDITGHQYWFDHPWASSDVILAIRSDLAPADRGLVQDDVAQKWYIPDDYPERLRSLFEQGVKLRTWGEAAN